MSFGIASNALKLVLLAAFFIDHSQGSTHVRLLRHSSLESRFGQRPRLPDDYRPPSALCIRDTGKHCEPYDRSSGAILDAMSQCHTHNAVNFSAPSPRVSHAAQSGMCDGEVQRCMCKPGFCADADMGCYEGTYDMLSTPFRITTKGFGQDMPLYMTRDGKVKMGEPPSEAAATWHVSVTRSGVKHLVTGAFRDVVLEEQTDCHTIVDSNGFPGRSCLSVVGHTSEPRADTTGWHFEHHSEFMDERSGDSGMYLQIRSVVTGSYMFIQPPPMDEAQMCVHGAANCPGDYGALRFDPPFPLDLVDSPFTIGEHSTNAYLWYYGLVLLVVICVYKTYSSLEAKSSRFDDDLSFILVIPLRNAAQCIGLRNRF